MEISGLQESSNDKVENDEDPSGEEDATRESCCASFERPVRSHHFGQSSGGHGNEPADMSWSSRYFRLALTLPTHALNSSGLPTDRN